MCNWVCSGGVSIWSGKGSLLSKGHFMGLNRSELDVDSKHDSDDIDIFSDISTCCRKLSRSGTGGISQRTEGHFAFEKRRLTKTPAGPKNGK